MKRSALVYTALGLGAIASLIFATHSGGIAAQTAAAPYEMSEAELAELRDLREGALRKLILHPAPKTRADIPYTDPDGGTRSLSEYQGKYILVNFWATWCAPCRKEMGSLDRLQAELGGEKFEVVSIATSRNPMPAITRFFDEENIQNLPILLDPKSTLAAEYGTISLPLTVILNPAGQEIGRLIGDAEWDSVSAKAIIRKLAGIEGNPS
jgi:thiol-disulfide isomerase/thioredoxin